MSPCVVFPGINAIVTVGGPVLLMHTAAGTVAFEWHEYLGPLPVRRDNGRERVLPDRHPFWALVGEWVRQGRKVDGGVCVVGPVAVCAKCGGTGRGIQVGRRSFMACPDCDGV